MKQAGFLKKKEKITDWTFKNVAQSKTERCPGRVQQPGLAGVQQPLREADTVLSQFGVAQMSSPWSQLV